MPLPIAAAIVAGSQLASSGINAVAQGKMNKKTRQWNEKMYGVQRRDALADWNMQNEYNSPQAQMARLKAAGLNPNLVYGDGAVANSTQAPRSSSPGNWSPHAPQVDFSGVGEGLAAYYDTRVKQAQIDNMAVQKELMEQEIKNKAAAEFKIYADTNKSVSQTEGQNIKNAYAPQIADMSLQGMQVAMEKAMAETDKTRVATGVMIDQNERAELKNGMDLKVAAERILNMRKERLKMDVDMLLKKAQTENVGQDTENKKMAWQKMLREKDRITWQIQQIEESINNLRSRTNLTNEQKRLLQSTPDWGDQRSLDMLEGLLNMLQPKGKRLGKNESVVNRKTGEIVY